MESKTGTTASAVESDSRSGEVSERIVTAVAEATGLDPLEMDPLFSVMDPDALNKLFSPSGTSPPPGTRLEFTMEGCEVVVHGDGEVAVAPMAETENQLTRVAPGRD
jgi:hypothetical protein